MQCRVCAQGAVQARVSAGIVIRVTFGAVAVAGVHLGFRLAEHLHQLPLGRGCRSRGRDGV